MKPSRHKVASIISQKSLSGNLSRKTIKELAAYLISTGRTNDLSSIMRDVNELWAEEGVIEVQVTTAHKLSPRLIVETNRIVKKTYPRAHKIEIIEQINPDLIGGIKLEFANKQLDLSLRTEIDKFKKVALAGRE